MKIKGLEKWGDDVLESKLDNGNTLYYVERGGMYFDVGIYLGKEKRLKVYNKVDESLMNTICLACKNHNRVRIWYGDRDSGRSWNEEYDVVGRIGRTMGVIKIPILVYNSRCYGGPAISVGSIIRIDDIEDKRTLWKVSNFHVELMEIKKTDNKDYPYSVMQNKDDGTIQNIASFKAEEQAKRWIDFMNGKRYCK
jgi:hypothetical protein